MSRRPFIAGNWKLNGNLQSAETLSGAIARNALDIDADIVLCPSFIHLAVVRVVLNEWYARHPQAEYPIALGAQNCSSYVAGAYTGEVSAWMLTESGCRYVIIGHSERRALFHETSAEIAQKCLAVRQADLSPIVCVGETLEERENDAVESVIAEQLDPVLDTVIDASGIEDITNLIIAYEPVWAIGTGQTATPEQAQAVHAMIRERVAARSATAAAALRILYGGSVKPDNAATLFAQPDIDGGLIGGAALDADSFLAICRAAA